MKKAQLFSGRSSKNTIFEIICRKCHSQFYAKHPPQTSDTPEALLEVLFRCA